MKGRYLAYNPAWKLLYLLVDVKEKENNSKYETKVARLELIDSLVLHYKSS